MKTCAPGCAISSPTSALLPEYRQFIFHPLA
jgi:hypothetical protein